MGYTSLGFLIFLCLLIPIYSIIPRRCRWVVLLSASYGFLLSFGIISLPLITATTCASFFSARAMERQKEKCRALVSDAVNGDEKKRIKTASRRRERAFLLPAVLINIGILASFKYFGHLTNRIMALTGFFGTVGNRNSVFFPMGISFYTFGALSYVIDVYRGVCRAEKNYFKLALYVSFFPILTEGPILSFERVSDGLFSGNTITWESFSEGSLRILYGYFKKLVVADTVMIAVGSILSSPTEHLGVYVLLLIILYSVEIYADFTGGIDISIGIARIFGVTLPENFNRPFSSRSLKEYWKRWHITMGAWFSSYVYYPLSVSRPMQKLSKTARQSLGDSIGKRLPVYISTLTTWFLTGLWHGQSANFYVWGLLNGVIILVSEELTPLFRAIKGKSKRLFSSHLWEKVSSVRTFFIVGSLRILDCYRDVPLTFRCFVSIFKVNNYRDIFDVQDSFLGLNSYTYVLILLSVALMYSLSRYGDTKTVCKRFSKNSISYACSAVFLLTATLIFGSYGIGFDAANFIYNQF